MVIELPASAWYERLPVGGQVRILPNHAGFTAAAYPAYHSPED